MLSSNYFGLKQTHFRVFFFVVSVFPTTVVDVFIVNSKAFTVC